jgi:hypothetical protein
LVFNRINSRAFARLFYDGENMTKYTLIVKEGEKAEEKEVLKEYFVLPDYYSISQEVLDETFGYVKAYMSFNAKIVPNKEKD